MLSSRRLRIRRFALLAALLLSLATVAPAQAATSTWRATVSGSGFGGTVTVTAATATTPARLTADLTGLKPNVMASLSVYAGKVGTNTYLVVRTRWLGSFVGGKWHLSVPLTSSMWSWFRYNVTYRGGNHVVLTQGTRTTAVMLVRI